MELVSALNQYSDNEDEDEDEEQHDYKMEKVDICDGKDDVDDARKELLNFQGKSQAAELTARDCNDVSSALFSTSVVGLCDDGPLKK